MQTQRKGLTKWAAAAGPAPGVCVWGWGGLSLGLALWLLTPGTVGSSGGSPNTHAHLPTYVHLHKWRAVCAACVWLIHMARPPSGHHTGSLCPGPPSRPSAAGLRPATLTRALGAGPGC